MLISLTRENTNPIFFQKPNHDLNELRRDGTVKSRCPVSKGPLLPDVRTFFSMYVWRQLAVGHLIKKILSDWKKMQKGPFITFVLSNTTLALSSKLLKS